MCESLAFFAVVLLYAHLDQLMLFEKLGQLEDNGFAEAVFADFKDRFKAHGFAAKADGFFDGE